MSLLHLRESIYVSCKEVAFGVKSRGAPAIKYAAAIVGGFSLPKNLEFENHEPVSLSTLKSYDEAYSLNSFILCISIELLACSIMVLIA